MRNYFILDEAKCQVTECHKATYRITLVVGKKEDRNVGTYQHDLSSLLLLEPEIGARFLCFTACNCQLPV